MSDRTRAATDGDWSFRSRRRWRSSSAGRRHIARDAVRRVRPSLGNLPAAGHNGYVAASDSPTEQIEIDECQAVVVRRIFKLYADGVSPRNIAARLNAEGVPSPGASWKRSRRRKDGKWLASAVHGDVRRGTGILNNCRYIGVVTWGRSEWRRSAVDSSVRRQRLLEKAQVERTDERLRIVPDELWYRVKARQELRSRDLGVRVRTGLRKRRNKTKYLLSGSLRCDTCRSSFALANRPRYQCASHHDGGADACPMSLSVPRDRIERVFMDYMASPELPRQLAEMKARWLSSQSATIDYGPRIAQLDKQRANLVEAIKSGSLAAELGAELKALAAELEQLRR